METEKLDQNNPPTEPSAQTEDSLSKSEDEKMTLLAQLSEKEAEAKTNYDLYVRERADLENFKRRMQREQSEAVRYANEPLIRDLLPVLDNLERAVGHAREGGNGQSLVEGVSLVVRSFLDILEKHGVSRVSAQGEQFDPSKHEAMAQTERSDVAQNTVVDEYCPAYLLHGRLLRPAMVTVAKTPPEEKKVEE